MKMPEYFCDEMIEGDFKAFKHDHYFVSSDGGTLMNDVIQFKSPYQLIGKFFNRIYLTSYLKNLVVKRNECIKKFAETGQWETILNKQLPTI
jgi:ligand-binding SRPBCC domain-containing protein